MTNFKNKIDLTTILNEGILTEVLSDHKIYTEGQPIFESTSYLQQTLLENTYPGIDRSIDPIKLANYLKTLNKKDQLIVQKIVDNTVYITSDEMFKSVNRSLDRFVKAYPKYNLYVPPGKIGSEHWIITELEKRLNPVQELWGRDNKGSQWTTDDKDFKLDNDYPIMVLDDGVYSSVNMCSTLDLMQYYTSIDNKIFIVVATTSSLRPQVVDFNATIVADKVFTDLKISNLFGDQLEYMKKTFGVEGNSVLPLYFDHKIANEFGSYQFYHKIIKNPISRAPINKISRENFGKVIDRLAKKEIDP